MNAISTVFGSSEQTPLVDISNLLSFDSIESIHIVAYKGFNSFRFYARIKFERNGDTFEKVLDAASLQEAYQKAYEFCSKL